MVIGLQTATRTAHVGRTVMQHGSDATQWQEGKLVWPQSEEALLSPIHQNQRLSSYCNCHTFFLFWIANSTGSNVRLYCNCDQQPDVYHSLCPCESGRHDLHCSYVSYCPLVLQIQDYTWNPSFVWMVIISDTLSDKTKRSTPKRLLCSPCQLHSFEHQVRFNWQLMQLLTVLEWQYPLSLNWGSVVYILKYFNLLDHKENILTNLKVSGWFHDDFKFSLVTKHGMTGISVLSPSGRWLNIFCVSNKLSCSRSAGRMRYCSLKRCLSRKLLLIY